MTWKLALALLKRFWPYVVVTGALLAAWLWHVGEIREARADERQKVRAQYQAALQKVIADREKALDEVADKYGKRIEDLNQSVAIELRGPPIRVCQYSVSVSAPQDTGGVHESAAGESTRSPSRDLRGEIIQRGRVCEGLRQQLIAIRELEQPNPR